MGMHATTVGMAAHILGVGVACVRSWLPGSVWWPMANVVLILPKFLSILVIAIAGLVAVAGLLQMQLLLF